MSFHSVFWMMHNLINIWHATSLTKLCRNANKVTRTDQIYFTLKVTCVHWKTLYG